MKAASLRFDFVSGHSGKRLPQIHAWNSAKKSSMTFPVVSAISLMSDSVVLYAGARSTWSPVLPSTVPVPG